jgi:hypothetical protein
MRKVEDPWPISNGKLGLALSEGHLRTVFLNSPVRYDI